ncbi:MAG: NADH-quinone oxidoreductase subunit F, partial [Actinomycetota bacterium]|nr:NADH-quinone oxidoreductase subunit F [Actinomycetota bacterium]
MTDFPRILTGLMTEHPSDSHTMARYQDSGGYQALRHGLAMSPADVAAVIKASNIRGRGGAGFPTGVKWG